MQGVKKMNGLAFAAAVLAATYAYGQPAGDQNPTDVKPAQAASPAAHPMENPSSPSVPGRERPRMEQPESRMTTGNSTSEERGTAQEQTLDRVLAACLLTGNQGEVELGKLAEQRATDRDVKEFAEQMVKDHGKQVETLQQYVGSQEPTDRRSQIDREIAERCTQNLKKELESKSGKEFDAAYIGAQIGGHLHMQAALAVIADQSSGQLREIVKDAQPVVDKHLEHAKKLMDELDKSTSDRRQASKQNSSER